MIRFQRLNRGFNKDFDVRALPAIIVCLLCFYFGYHLIQGERSILSYLSNKAVIEQKETELASLTNKAAILEEDVEKLRIATLDTDFLEERARYILGYLSEDEVMLIQE